MTSTSDQFAVRPAHPDDRPGLVRLMCALQEHERTLHENRVPGPMVADSHLNYLEDCVARQQGRILVAEADGTPVGFLVCMVESLEEGDLHVAGPHRRWGWISDLFVEPEWRGHGVAAALVEAGEAHCRERGMRHMRVGFLYLNREAEAAYRALGYRPYEVIWEKSLAG